MGDDEIVSERREWVEPEDSQGDPIFRYKRFLSESAPLQERVEEVLTDYRQTAPHVHRPQAERLRVGISVIESLQAEVDILNDRCDRVDDYWLKCRAEVERVRAAIKRGGSMRKYRKKPVEIEAVQWLPAMDDSYVQRVFDWMRAGGCDLEARATGIAIKTLEGTMLAEDGDWIIKGVKGEFYPCKPDIFDASYEPAEDFVGEPDA